MALGFVEPIKRISKLKSSPYKLYEKREGWLRMDIDELILKFELDGCLQMLHLQKMLEEKGILSVLNSKKARIDVFLQEEDRASENPAFMIVYKKKDDGLPFLDIIAFCDVPLWNFLALLWRQSSLEYKAYLTSALVEDAISKNEKQTIS